MLFANCYRRRLRTGRRRRTSDVFSGRHDGTSGQIGLMRSESDSVLLLAEDRRVVGTELPPPPPPPPRERSADGGGDGSGDKKKI
ncbi:unnamed protein product [Macrosiphum euphorbiae]|uniref:Uncharacterized protein n=1 Tax=Macrosiphum euphorbiae TaxID=13131 RepID=A0AAV0WV84_9HEMI|nr:unnamed protein product [Macrosiphum euphorbiae]